MFLEGRGGSVIQLQSASVLSANGTSHDDDDGESGVSLVIPLAAQTFLPCAARLGDRFFAGGNLSSTLKKHET